MLGLASATSEAWIERALANFDEILLDHAHCEKKAASTAINLIFRYPDQTPLLVPLSQLAREELRHFEQVLGLLDSRGVAFERQKPSPYAGELMAAVRNHEPARLLDTLICCSLIEARSHERMRLLAERLEDETLRRLYSSLLASEERHHHTYVGLAETIFSRHETAVRLGDLSRHEAEVIDGAPELPRMHC